MKLSLSALFLVVLLLAVTLASAMESQEPEIVEVTPKSKKPYGQKFISKPTATVTKHAKKLLNDVQTQGQSLWDYLRGLFTGIDKTFEWVWSLFPYAAHTFVGIGKEAELKPVPALIIALASLLMHMYLFTEQAWLCVVGQAVIMGIDYLLRHDSHQGTCHYSMIFPLTSMFSHLSRLAVNFLNSYTALVPGFILAALVLMTCTSSSTSATKSSH